MQDTISIITAVSRPRNLSKISSNIKKTFTKCQVFWYTIFDKRCRPTIFPDNIFHHEFLKSDISGAPQKNKGIELAEGWLYFLDDDNLMNINYEYYFLEARNEFPDAKAFVFNQMHNGKLRLKADNPQLVDCAQFIINKSIIGNIRFPLNDYASDRVFFSQIYNENRNLIKFIDEPATNYNKLRELS